MNSRNESGFLPSPAVNLVVKQIVDMFRPNKVYLYNQRISSSGDTSAFKICIVADIPDKTAAERDLYLAIDCEVPFDVLLYTPGEWDQLTQSATSFAYKIQSTGLVLYG